jgi:hypothetical protein
MIPERILELERDEFRLRQHRRSITSPAESGFAFGRLRITLDDRFPTIREDCP